LFPHKKKKTIKHHNYLKKPIYQLKKPLN
jgi:hypothetical protein